MERRHQHDNQKNKMESEHVKIVYWKLLTKDHNGGGGGDEGIVPNKLKEIQ